MARSWQVSEFVAAVKDSDFTGPAYTAKQTERLQSARRAYLGLSEDEQRELAEIAGRITTRGYGPLAAFEVLSTAGMMLARKK